MGYYDFPHTRNYDSDLGFLIKRYNELGKDYDTLVKIYEQVKKNIEDITIEQLQEWLDNGTIENLILQMGKVIKIIDTTDNLINKNYNLVEGNVVKTLGFYNSNDGGVGLFYITSIKNVDFFQFEITNNLYATLIIENQLNILSLGCLNTKPTSEKQQNINNASIINNAIKKLNETGVSIYIPNGVYYLNEPIIIENNITINLDDSAILFANANMEYLIGINPLKKEINCINSIEGLLRFNISGGIFDCNNLAKRGIIANKYFRCTIENFVIKNFLDVGVSTRYDEDVPGDVNGAYLGLRYGSIRGSSNIKSNVGVYSPQPDNSFNDIEVIDCSTGFLLGPSNHCVNCTTWLSRSDMYNGSIAYRIQNGKTSSLINCISDTMELSVYISSQSKQCLISDLTVINNNTVINPQLAGIIPTILFSESGSEALVKVVNLNVNYNFIFNLTNIPQYLVKNSILNLICDNQYVHDVDNFSELDYLYTNQTNLFCKISYDEKRHVYIFDSYNKDAFTIKNGATVSSPAFGILGQPYIAIPCIAIGTDNLIKDLKLFKQNNTIILFNDTGSDVTIRYFKGVYEVVNY